MGHGSADVTGGGESLNLYHNVRGYAVNDFQARTWEEMRYTKLELLGRTLSWTTDLSNVGCGCNAALYLVAMPDGGSASGSGYCDDQMGASACVELDLQEGNNKAIQATLHTVSEASPSSDGVCNQWGTPPPRPTVFLPASLPAALPAPHSE